MPWRRPDRLRFRLRFGVRLSVSQYLSSYAPVAKSGAYCPPPKLHPQPSKRRRGTFRGLLGFELAGGGCCLSQKLHPHPQPAPSPASLPRSRAHILGIPECPSSTRPVPRRNYIRAQNPRLCPPPFLGHLCTPSSWLAPERGPDCTLAGGPGNGVHYTILLLRHGLEYVAALHKH